MLTHTNAAAVHTALKAKIKKAQDWSVMEASAHAVRRDVEGRAHMEGRAWAFGMVLEWLKEVEK